jgi:glycolate oxidase iron-sulfur subunit
MQHTIPVSQLVERVGPQVEAMAGAIEACVHCGFCLAVCPTYQVLGEEMDSPRGRISLMKTVLEGDLSAQEAMPYIDRCLGCLACVTACPSGVRYGELVSPFRAYAKQHTPRRLAEKVQHRLIKETLPYPGRFRPAAALGRLARPLSAALPQEMRGMLELLPGRLPPAPGLPAFTPAVGVRRARVAFLVGCIQQVIAPEINWATLRVLARNGIEVLVPSGQTCCGAILMHTGDYEEARKLAQNNLGVFPEDVDAILTNAAGCGSGMKEYGLLFKGLEDEGSALRFSARVHDVSQFLVNLGLVEPPALSRPVKVAYHDACHLAHAQGITEAPRSLLAAIGDLSLLEINDGGICCGSAGTYNLEQPEIAAELGRRKVENILASGAEVVAAGNIGCIVQIRSQLQSTGKQLPVFHTLELLDMAYSRYADISFSLSIGNSR